MVFSYAVIYLHILSNVIDRYFCTGFNMACEETITQLLMKNLADFLSHYEALLRDSENDPFNNFDELVRNFRTLKTQF